MANPYLAGATGRCPRCGKGKLFDGFLGLAPACSACGASFEQADSGDGPAVFVILIAGFLLAFGAMFHMIAFNPPIWVLLVIWMPLTVAVCLGLLRPMKGLLIAARFANKASEAGRADVEP
ncbi:MAG: DUF983 domain-containing protein [Caulobacter sp.]|nr:DUF983 domain-containing protein [Caulobacter sp.]